MASSSTTIDHGHEKLARGNDFQNVQDKELMKTLTNSSELQVVLREIEHYLGRVGVSPQEFCGYSTLTHPALLDKTQILSVMDHFSQSPDYMPSMLEELVFIAMNGSTDNAVTSFTADQRVVFDPRHRFNNYLSIMKKVTSTVLSQSDQENLKALAIKYGKTLPTGIEFSLRRNHIGDLAAKLEDSDTLLRTHVQTLGDIGKVADQLPPSSIFHDSDGAFSTSLNTLSRPQLVSLAESCVGLEVGADDTKSELVDKIVQYHQPVVQLMKLISGMDDDLSTIAGEISTLIDPLHKAVPLIQAAEASKATKDNLPPDTRTNTGSHVSAILQQAASTTKWVFGPHAKWTNQMSLHSTALDAGLIALDRASVQSLRLLQLVVKIFYTRKHRGLGANPGGRLLQALEDVNNNYAKILAGADAGVITNATGIPNYTALAVQILDQGLPLPSERSIKAEHTSFFVGLLVIDGYGIVRASQLRNDIKEKMRRMEDSAHPLNIKEIAQAMLTADGHGLFSTLGHKGSVLHDGVLAKLSSSQKLLRTMAESATLPQKDELDAFLATIDDARSLQDELRELTSSSASKPPADNTDVGAAPAMALTGDIVEAQVQALFNEVEPEVNYVGSADASQRNVRFNVSPPPPAEDDAPTGPRINNFYPHMLPVGVDKSICIKEGCTSRKCVGKQYAVRFSRAWKDGTGRRGPSAAQWRFAKESAPYQKLTDEDKKWLRTAAGDYAMVECPFGHCGDQHLGIPDEITGKFIFVPTCHCGHNQCATPEDSGCDDHRMPYDAISKTRRAQYERKTATGDVMSAPSYELLKAKRSAHVNFSQPRHSKNHLQAIDKRHLDENDPLISDGKARRAKGEHGGRGSGGRGSGGRGGQGRGGGQSGRN